MTGAEAPNDKIYFGSPLIKYSDEKINAKDAWVTTDFNIVNFQKEPEKAGYHIFSSDVLIEPDKQITLKKSDLFIKGKKVTSKKIKEYLVSINKMDNESEISGIDTEWSKTLTSIAKLKGVFNGKIENNKEIIEDIIFWSTIYFK